MNETPRKIAVLGPRQSGKTCLAAGLSAVNTPGFTIQSGDNVSGELLAGIKAALQSKEKASWPPGNNTGDTNEINLVFQKTGKPPVPVTFLDFAGERIQTPEAFKEFAEKHLVGLSGAVVLVNPGADAFLDGGARARQEALSHYERLFAWFRDKGSKPLFVALTVTASDRLEADGDLAGRKEAVEDFVGKLENILQTIKIKGITCRRFSVTITGHLENQSKPKLAKKRDNTSAKPFLWLLDELKWAPIRAGIWRKIRLAAWVALLCAVLWGIWTAMEKNVAEGKIESLAGDVRAALESGKANAATKAKEKFQELKGMTNGLGKALAGRKLLELEPGVWRLFKNEIEDAILRIEGNPSSKASPDAVLNVDRCFETFVPQYDNGAKEEYKRLKDEWASQKPEWQEQYKKQLQHSDYLKPIDSVAKFLDQLAGKDDVLNSLLGLYRDLARVQPPGDSQKLAEEKQTVAKRLDDRTAEEFRHIAKETFKGGLSRDKAQVQAASLRERLSVWTPMTEDGKSAKEEIAKSIESMTSLSTNAWDAEQRAICENWVKDEIEQHPKRSLAGQGGVWSAYQTFARTNANNPYFASIVQKRVYELAEELLESNVTWFTKDGGGTTNLWTDKANFKDQWGKVNKQFDGFRQLCREIKDDKTPLHTSWAWQFACLCMDGKMIDSFDNAFPQTLVLTQVVASVDYATDTNYTRHVPVNYEFTAFGAKINVESFNLNGSPNATACFDILPFYKSGVDAEEDADNAVVASKNKGDGPQEKVLFSGELSIPVHAFERVSLAMVATDWNNGTARHSLKPVRTEGLTWGLAWPGFAPEGRDFDLSFDINRNLISHTPKELFLTFYGQVEGESMADCLRQAKENAKKAVAGK